MKYIKSRLILMLSAAFIVITCYLLKIITKQSLFIFVIQLMSSEMPDPKVITLSDYRCNMNKYYLLISKFSV